MKLLVVVSRVPYPLDKGDKLRVYHQMKQLAKQHEIHLCCLDDNNTKKSNIEELKKFCSSVTVLKLSKPLIYFNLFKALFSSKPFQVHYFYQKKAHRKIKKRIKELQPDRIYSQLIRTAEYVKNEHSYIKTIDYMDAFSKGMDRRVKDANILYKQLIREEAKRLLKYEHLIYDYFDGHTIISKEDRDWIHHPNRKKIEVVTNGIDIHFFCKKKETTPLYDLIFVGNMSYAPNIEAVKFLVQEILPLLNKKTKVLIAGATPTKEVLKLASKNVTVTGWIEDIREAYSNAKIFVAPLFIGTGLQNKLLEAMAMELPCVTTPLVNKSLKAKEQETIRIAQNKEEFAKEIVTLLKNKEEQTKLGINARKFVEKQYSWQKSTKILEEVIKREL